MGRIVPIGEVTKLLESRGWSLAQVLEKAVLYRDPQGMIVPVPIHRRHRESVDSEELEALLPGGDSIEQGEVLAHDSSLGFDVVIDPGDCIDSDLHHMLAAFEQLNRSVGGTGVEVMRIEWAAVADGGGAAELPEFGRARTYRLEPRDTEGAPLRAHYRSVAIIAHSLSRIIVREPLDRSLRAMARTLERLSTVVVAPPDNVEVRNALKAVDDGVKRIVAAHGAVGLVHHRLESVIGRAAVELPDDPSIISARREVGYRRLADVGALPASPEVALEIMQLSRADAGPHVLAEVVKRDPTIAGTVLEQANSAAVRPIAPIHDLIRAVHHLGPQWVQGIAFKCTVVARHRSGACKAFDYEAFWQECTARAVASARIARFGDHRFTAEEAWAAGLLCQIGRLAFAATLPRDYSEVLESAWSGREALLAREREVFKLDHDELGAEMIRGWGMGDFFWQAVLFQDDHDILAPGSAAADLAHVLRWSGLIWSIFERRGNDIEPELRERAKLTAERLGMPRAEFGPAFDAVRDEWEWLGSLLEITTFDVRSWEEIEGSGEATERRSDEGTDSTS